MKTTIGLEKPKERILEYLAVQSLVKKLRGPILCLSGRPVWAKHPLPSPLPGPPAGGLSGCLWAESGMRRKSGGTGGHTSARCLEKSSSLCERSNVNNPVFCLDEVDKMSMDFRGDPSAALLEVLDPEQNYSFNDHYLDVEYDLSDILFITTANTLT